MAAPRRASARRAHVACVWLVILAIGMTIALLPATAALEARLLDAGFLLLQRLAPKHASADIAVIGIDEATLEAFPEPIALWHPYLGTILNGLASARPRAVGIDLELPDRSYESLRPGSDRNLLDGMLALRATTPLVVALGLSRNGTVKPLHAPFLAAAGEDGAGLPAYPIEADQRVRRFDERLGDAGARIPTFVGALARRLGAEPRPGWIDFSLGPPFEYIPAHQVYGWAREGRTDMMRQAFSGRIVLLGAVLPFVDRHAVPARLAAWESGLSAPGVLLHAQTLRSLLGAGLVRDAHPLIPLALVVAASTIWFAFASLKLGVAVLAGSIAVGIAGALWLLHAGTFLPIGPALATALIGAATRAGHEAWFQRRERDRLKRAFSGYVSPRVLDLIVAGKLDTEVGTGRRNLCVLFADIRNFTALSERSTPESMVALLNDYFARMTRAIHAHDGTVDNFRGDGIMCFFGAPQPSPNPCLQGFLACREMLQQLAELNRELESRHVPALQVGISLAYGEAVVGSVGAAERHEYTAIGDVANVSARLENMTKELGYPVLLTAEAGARISTAAAFDDLGIREIKGHAPVQVYGWPARAAAAAATTVEQLRIHHG